MTEQEWDIKSFAIGSEMWERLKEIEKYGNEVCFHPSNQELIEKWWNHMNEPCEEEK